MMPQKEMCILSDKTLECLEKYIKEEKDVRIYRKNILESSDSDGNILEILSKHLTDDNIQSFDGNFNPLSTKYNLIVALPPFNNWKEHLQKYYQLLSRIEGVIYIILPAEIKDVLDIIEDDYTTPDVKQLECIYEFNNIDNKNQLCYIYKITTKFLSIF